MKNLEIQKLSYPETQSINGGEPITGTAVAIGIAAVVITYGAGYVIGRFISWLSEPEQPGK